MNTSLTTRVILSCAAIMAALAATIYLAMAVPGASRPERDRSRAGPALNQAQATAMLPAIDAYLDRDASRLGGGGDLSSKLKPRTFCDASIIEIRPGEMLASAGVRPFVLSWRVGIVTFCAEFARRGPTLLEGPGGYPSLGEVITVAGGPGDYRAGSLDVGPPFWDPSWVHARFSPRGATLVLNEKVTAPDPVRQARRVFGFPPATRAVQD